MKPISRAKRILKTKWFGGQVGQIAAVLLLIIAVAIIIYAVVINIQRVSEMKASTMVAAESGAATLAVGVGGYAEKLLQEQLGGERKVCGWTGLLAKLITFVVLVVVAIITYNFCGPGCATALAQTMTAISAAAAAAAVMVGISIVLEITVVQPGIDKLWNKLMANKGDIRDQVLERGIQAALSAAVADPIQVPDLHDLDTDTLFGPTLQDDAVSRFSVYYTSRLRQETPSALGDVIKDFKAGLEDFVRHPSRPLVDPLTCAYCPADPGAAAAVAAHPCCTDHPRSDPNFPAECDPCCLPDLPEEVEGVAVNPIRPDCCSSGGERCGNPNTCGARSQLPGDLWPYVYNPYVENWYNDTLSINERLGRDDEHPDFARPMSDPNWGKQVPRSVMPEPENVPGYYLTDTTGYYKPPVFPDGPDPRTSAFGFFYKMADWGAELPSLHYGAGGLDREWKQCHWCDPEKAPEFACRYDLAAVNPEIAPPLHLPLEIGEEFGQSRYSGGPCVDNTNDPAAAGATLIDKVAGLPPDVLVSDDYCALNNLNGWKRGADVYCSSEAYPGSSGMGWPYLEDCPKHQGCGEDGCQCPAGGGSQWPEDGLDFIVYSIPDFVLLADYIINTDVASLVTGFRQWYPLIAEWIAPAEGSSWWGKLGVEETETNVNDMDRDGWLYDWWEIVLHFNKAMRDWTGFPDLFQTPPYIPPTNYVGTSCSEVWCVPPEDTSDCACEPPEEEKQTFSFAHEWDSTEEVRGDVVEISACLQYNAENSRRFLDCHETCMSLQRGVLTGDATSTDRAIFSLGEGACEDLPRSLVAGFCEIEFVPPDMEALQSYLTCLDAYESGDPAAFNEACAELPGMEDMPFEGASWMCSADEPLSSDVVRQCPTLGQCTCTDLNTGQTRVCSSDEVLSGNETRNCDSSQCICHSADSGSSTAGAAVDCPFQAPAPEGWVMDCGNCVCENTSTGGQRACTPNDVLPDEAISCSESTCLCTDIRGSQGDAGFIAALYQKLMEAGGSCFDEKENGFMPLLRQSVFEAMNQGTKMLKRVKFLEGLDKSESTRIMTLPQKSVVELPDEEPPPPPGEEPPEEEPPPELAPGETVPEGTPFMINGFVEMELTSKTFTEGFEKVAPGRIEEAINIIETMEHLATSLDFLIFGNDAPRPTPVMKLLDIAGKIDDLPPEPCVEDRGEDGPPWSSTVVYVWKDPVIAPEDVPPGVEPPARRWHAVKVEGRVTGRCLNACGVGGGADPGWPKIKTWKSSWGLKRCYELIRHTGMTKIRVIRFDSGAEGQPVTFPDKTPIWELRTQHPDTETIAPSELDDAIMSACRGYVLGDFLGTEYETAFMINDPCGECWQRVHELMLSHGVETESCAEYYITGRGPGIPDEDSIRIRFVPCDQAFQSGNN